MSSSEKVQMLPPEAEYCCNSCGERVVFKVVRTRPIGGDMDRVIAYLECPLCGNKARQVRWKRLPKSEK